MTATPRLRFLLLLAALSLVPLAGCTDATDASAQGPPPGAGQGPPRDAPVPVVDVVPARAGALTRTLTFTGEVIADRVVDITPLESGHLAELLVDEGDVIERGALLARLDDELQDRRRRETDASRRSADAQVRQAEAELGRLERDIERREALRQRDALPRAELEALVDQRAVLEAALAAAEARRDEVTAASASRRTELDRRRVVAPFDGLVARRLADSGAAVSPQQALLTLVDTDSLEFVARLPEQRLAELEVGQSASITLDASPEQTLRVSLRRLGSMIERESRTVEARFRFEQHYPGVRHGMFGRGRMTLEQGEALVNVPDHVIESTDDEEHVLWVVRDDEARRQVVEIVYRLEGRVAVRGVDEGEPVITSPTERLEDGQQVRARPRAEATPGGRR